MVALLGAACASEEPAPAEGTDTGTTAPSDAGGGDDLLARIQEEGVIRVSTDPAYPPQSSLNEETDEYEGFDIDVATEIANRLGVDDRVGDSVVERDHLGWVERSMGHVASVR